MRKIFRQILCRFKNNPYICSILTSNNPLGEQIRNERLFMDRTQTYITFGDFHFYNCKKIVVNEEHGCNYEIRCSDEFEGLSDDTALYKYIKLPYLLDLLKTGNLYVSRRGDFTDRRDSKGEKKNISEYINTYEFVEKSKKKQKETKEQKKRLIWTLFVSCWTLNINSEGRFAENYLLWKTYNDTNLICRIGTTIGKLINSIEQLSNDIVFSPIQYEPFDKAHIDTPFWNTFVKADFYRDEKEVRLIALPNPYTNCKDRYVLIPVNVKNMITQVAISPFVSKTTQDFISEQLISQYPFLKGKINAMPIIEY